MLGMKRSNEYLSSLTIVAACFAAAAALSSGLYVGWRLRRASLERAMDPYHHGRKPEFGDEDYAMGI